MIIETVTTDNIEKILPLIADYQRFYRMEPATDRNPEFFLQLSRHPELGIQFAAFTGSGEALGFTTLYFHPSSLSAREYCLLNDLYTTEAARGKGVGRALMQHAAAYAKTRGFSRIDWMTERNNERAQMLYDKLGASKSEWFYYSLPV